MMILNLGLVGIDFLDNFYAYLLNFIWTFGFKSYFMFNKKYFCITESSNEALIS